MPDSAVWASPGKPVNFDKTVAGGGPIDAAEIVKGYESRKGEFVLVQPEEIDEIRLESSGTGRERQEAACSNGPTAQSSESGLKS